MKAAATALALLALLVGCDDDAAAEASTVEAVSFEHHECAACGMIVREQPAPRGQLVHRDGTRVHFCAISDLAAYVGAPSPHGEPVGIFVEAMAPDVSPDDLSTVEGAWVDVHEASFVVGEFTRPVMGRPVLTFSSEGHGREAAERLGGRALDWSGLLAELERASENSH